MDMIIFQHTGCGNLPLSGGVKPPSTLVQVKSYAKPSDMNPLATLFKTEVIEVIKCVVCTCRFMEVFGNS